MEPQGVGCIPLTSFVLTKAHPLVNLNLDTRSSASILIATALAILRPLLPPIIPRRTLGALVHIRFLIARYLGLISRALAVSQEMWLVTIKALGSKLVRMMPTLAFGNVPGIQSVERVVTIIARITIAITRVSVAAYVLVRDTAVPI